MTFEKLLYLLYAMATIFWPSAKIGQNGMEEKVLFIEQKLLFKLTCSVQCAVHLMNYIKLVFSSSIEE
jgi:hypothetical protein